MAPPFPQPPFGKFRTPPHDSVSHQVSLEWPGEPGFLYDLEVSDNLQCWSTLVFDIPGSGNPTAHTLPDPPLNTQTERFYRIVLHD